MIIETDFLDHWKTRLIVRLLGTESAPLHIIRLWSHCQTRKTNRFPDWNPEILSAVCKWGGDADAFWSAILQTFGRIEDGCFVAHQWDEVNSSLIAAWSNGVKGGRHKKPTDNPRVNPELNQVNPQITHGVTDREEKMEKKDTEDPKSPWCIKYDLIIPEKLQTSECLAAVETWLAYKAERKQGYKRIGLSAALQAWSNEYTAETFPAAVNHSIASNYQGIFPPRGSLASGANTSRAAGTFSPNIADYL